MSNRALKAGFAAVILVAAARMAPAIADPTGLWVDKDGWTIRIQACGPDLCAVIASVKPALVRFPAPDSIGSAVERNGTRARSPFY